jgi:hypothetical protein
MPRKTPDGRTESPGVLRIYLSSMIILALFYACSAVLSLLLRVAAAALRAVGLIGAAAHCQSAWGSNMPCFIVALITLLCDNSR